MFFHLRHLVLCMTMVTRCGGRGLFNMGQCWGRGSERRSFAGANDGPPKQSLDGAPVLTAADGAGPSARWVPGGVDADGDGVFDGDGEEGGRVDVEVGEGGRDDAGDVV